MKIVILAGGSGTRLWPLSRSTYPKQFLRFGSEHSLLQRTVLRFLKRFSISDLLIVTSQEYLHLVRSQLISIDPELEHRISVEPYRKNTMPAIAWTFKVLEEKDQLEMQEPVLVCPSDHVIAPEELFLDKVQEAAEKAQQGKIIAFGVHPTHPETGYGYIKVQSAQHIGPVEAFVEKPNLETAMADVVSGQVLWNDGIFMLTREAFWKESSLYQEEIGKLAAMSTLEVQQIFTTLPEISFDYAVMEKTDSAMVMPLEISWSDVGSWDSIYDTLEKDDCCNVALGNIHAIDTSNSLIIGGKRLISTIGLEDMLVVDTEDALFIAKRGESQRVKALVDTLKDKGSKQVVEHVEVHRPWGSYTTLEEGLHCGIRRIRVAPKRALSLQAHHHRSEHWVVVHGVAKVTIGAKEMFVKENESVFVPKSCIHRLENASSSLLEIIEVQVGEYLSEEDIVRFEEHQQVIKAEP